MGGKDDKITVENVLNGTAGDIETRLLFNSASLKSILQIVVTAIATAFFIQWWALPWAALMIALVFVRSDPKVETMVPKGAVGVIAIAGGTIVHMSAWVAAWLMGGPEAGFLAGVMLGSQALYSTNFFASSRAHFLANLAPVLIVGASAPFLIYDHAVPVTVALCCVVQNYIAASMARGNRNDMLVEVLRIQSEMEAARDASMAKSQFLATMSHELRTPLNAIIGYAEILEEDLSDDGSPQSAQDAARIRRSAKNLLSLINDILDFSKIEAGRMDVHPDRVDVKMLIDDVVQTVAHLTEANRTTLTVDIAPNATMLVTDEQKLRQCLLNLVSNAAKFTESGRIIVRAAIEPHSDGNVLRVDVQDTGCGIAEDDAARLFQPFSQIDGSLTRKSGGTGLGLMITKRLSELLGGDVACISKLGAGSTFTLRVRDLAQNQIASDGEGPLVLMIEDQAAARDIMRRALDHLPVRIAEAHNADMGLTAALAHKPQLIVLDIHLPDLLGWDLLAELKANSELRDVPVLVVSVDDDRARAMRLGACDHLLKPVDRERLAATVLRFVQAEPQRRAVA